LQESKTRNNYQKIKKNYKKKKKKKKHLLCDKNCPPAIVTAKSQTSILQDYEKNIHEVFTELNLRRRKPKTQFTTSINGEKRRTHTKKERERLDVPSELPKEAIIIDSAAVLQYVGGAQVSKTNSSFIGRRIPRSLFPASPRVCHQN
jgi:hypothetical protein